MFSLESVIIVISACSIAASSSDVINYGSCRTPHNELGYCVHLSDCRYVADMILSRNRSVLQFAERSQCGYDANQVDPERIVLVCCPLDRQKKQNFLDSNANICGRFVRNRIYGGNATKIAEFPWMALLQYTNTSNASDMRFFCGGTLINSRYILTAAHCVQKPHWQLSTVRLGEWNLETNPDCDYDMRGNKRDCAAPHVDVAVEAIIAHAGFVANSINLFHDIALVRLKQEVSFNEFIKPICLPVAMQLRNSLFENTSMDVAGWGMTEHNTTSSIKLKVRVNVWNISECQQRYSANPNFRTAVNGSQQLCAGGEKGVDTCSGDSGAGLMVIERLSNRDSYFIAGIVSYGTQPCGLKGWPGVYTHVGNYMDWIMENMQP